MRLRSFSLIPMVQWLSSIDGIKILQLSTALHNGQCGSIDIDLPIPWEYYSRSRVYDAVRDYLVLQYIKEKYQNSAAIDFFFVRDLVATLCLTQLAKQLEDSKRQSKQKSLIWQDILTAITPYNKNIEEKSLLNIKERLTNCGYKPDQLDAQCAKLTALLKERAHIVLTFDSAEVDIQSERILNFFESKRNQNSDYSDLRVRRLTAEIFHFLDAKTHRLQEFSLNCQAHPCYASLQFRIAPITHYGESFIVIDTAIRKSATAIFGAPLETKSGLFDLRLKPVRLSESPIPLIAQFSGALFKVCLDLCAGKPFPADFGVQYLKEKTQYIELQLLENIPLHDPGIIRHMHLVFNEHSQFAKIDQLITQGISVSIGANPYDRLDMNKPSLDSEMQKFLITETLGHIYQAALIIAETNPLHLNFTADETSLRFSMKITPNSPQLHQAQAAALLYCLGVRNYFKKVSALSLDEKNFNYVLPLTGQCVETGSLADHDAYTYSYGSLKKLLEKLLTRIFSVLFISKQNEQYYVAHNKSHPLTGKGATEEENQVKFLGLGEEKPYTVAVHWAYDRVVIEVPSTEAHAEWIMQCISALIKTKISREKSLIYLNMPLAKVFAALQKHYFAYQATVIYDDGLLNYGKLLLAYRMGFATPGGHNNDPYSWIDAFLDIEFGQLQSNWGDVQSQKNCLGSSQEPSTIYYSLPTSCLHIIKEDNQEFVQGSLYRFDIWRLGNLSLAEIHLCAKVWGITSQEYIENYGHALLLRPVPSIIVYLEWAQITLSEMLANLFYNVAPFTVKIAHDFKEINVGDRIYWRPEPRFGRIEISGEVQLLKTLAKKLKENYHLLVGFVNESVIILDEINPHALIRIVGHQWPELINSDSTLIQEVLRSSEHHFTFLSQYNPTRICEILTYVYKDSTALVNSLGNLGGDFLLRLIKEKLSLSAREEKSISPEKSTPLDTLFALLVKESWGLLEKSNLHVAVENNDLQGVKYLSEDAHIFVGARDKNWDTPLHYACRLGQLEIVKYFVDSRKADLFSRNLKRQSLWFVAALNNRWDIIEFLTESLDKPPFDKRRPPSAAKLNSDLIIEAKSEEKNQSILYILCCCFPYNIQPINKFYDVFIRLLQLFKSCVNLRNVKGETVLHAAARHNLYKIIKPLIEAKSDVNCRDFNGETIVDKAMINENQGIDVLSQLSECGIDVMAEIKTSLVKKESSLWSFVTQEREVISLSPCPELPNLPEVPTVKSAEQNTGCRFIAMLSQLPPEEIDKNMLYLIMVNQKITAYWRIDNDIIIKNKIQQPQQSALKKYFVSGATIVKEAPEFKEITLLSGYNQAEIYGFFSNIDAHGSKYEYEAMPLLALR